MQTTKSEKENLMCPRIADGFSIVVTQITTSTGKTVGYRVVTTTVEFVPVS